MLQKYCYVNYLAADLDILVYSLDNTMIFDPKLLIAYDKK